MYPISLFERTVLFRKTVWLICLVFFCLAIRNPSFGQSSQLSEQIAEVTDKIEQNKENAGLFLERSRLLFELGRDELRQVRQSVWTLPCERVGVESNRQAMHDASTALRLDPKLAAAYFHRAEVNLAHPDVFDFMTWTCVSKTGDLNVDGAYAEYGRSDKPSLARRIISDQILADVNAGLQLQPKSVTGRDRRWFVLVLLDKSDQVLGEINIALNYTGISEERRIELLRLRVFTYKSQRKLGTPHAQVQADEQEIYKYGIQIQEVQLKADAEKLVLRLSKELRDTELNARERATKLEFRARMYRRLDSNDDAENDMKAARLLWADVAGENIARLTSLLSSDDLKIEERIQLLKGRASHYRTVGDSDNFQNDSIEAERLELERAEETCMPLINRLTVKIKENKSNARIEYSLLKRRARLYERINKGDLAKSDLKLAKQIYEEGYKINSTLIGGELAHQFQN